MKSKVQEAECPGVPAIKYPFFWQGQSGSIWMRTHSVEFTPHPDISVSESSFHRIGAHHGEAVPDHVAWSKRLPPGSTVLLTQE